MGEPDHQIFGQILSQHGGPAFVRRGRDVQRAFDGQLEACRQKREEWLEFVRLTLGTLFALAGSDAALEKFLDNPRQFQRLTTLYHDLQPRLRLPPNPTSNGRVLRRAVADVQDAIERFNQRWRDYMGKLDLQSINQIRDRYNRFYLLEKECALGSSRLVRHGFQELKPLRPEDFLSMMPLLPVS